jgi:tetrahydromethanopterin S-methyltransferase subunit E
MDPDWLGSPQHFVGAALIAGVVALITRTRLDIGFTLAVLLGMGVALTVQAVWEVAEYLIRYADQPYASAYYDTIADTASALAGALTGASLTLVARARS